jgi:hypothetical protein
MITNINESISNSLEERTKNQKIKRLNKRRNRNSLWTQEEENKLITLVNEYGKKWSLIASYFEGKTNYDCFYHFSKNLIEIEWSQDEDIKMIKFLRENGKSWKACGVYMNKNARECFKRYKILRKKLGNKVFSFWGLEEELKLVLLVSKIGKCWEKIKTYFPEKEKTYIARKFYTLLRNFVKNNIIKETNSNISLENLMKYLPFLINEIQGKLMTYECGRNTIIKVYKSINEITNDRNKIQDKLFSTDSKENMSDIYKKKQLLKEIIKNKIKAKLTNVLKNRMPNIPTEFLKENNEGSVQDMLDKINLMKNLIMKVNMAIKI